MKGSKRLLTQIDSFPQKSECLLILNNMWSSVPDREPPEREVFREAQKKSSTAIFEIQGIYGSKTNFMRSQSFVYLSNSGSSGLSFSNNSKARKSHTLLWLRSQVKTTTISFYVWFWFHKPFFAGWNSFLIKLVNIPQQRSTKEGLNQKGWIGWIGP